MSIAGRFIAALQQERAYGNVSGETEQKLRHEVMKLGDTSVNLIRVAVRAEIHRHERQVATLRRLQEALLGSLTIFFNLVMGIV
jgi:hypothetical protein